MEKKYKLVKRREKKNVAREDRPVIKIFTDSQIMAIDGGMERWFRGYRKLHDHGIIRGSRDAFVRSVSLVSKL